MMDDICFILEGTYPFLRGGVSSWTHNLIEDMPDLTFSLLAISPVKGPPKEFEYPIPENVTNIVETFLYNDILPNQPCPNKKNKDLFWDVFFDYLTGKNNQYGFHFEKMFPLLCDTASRAVNAVDIMNSRESHELTEKLYEEKKKDTCSFFDFFWTWRSMLLVFIQAINVEIPPAKVYHASCTGYSGLIGALAKLKYNRPLILTEHGIYTKERKIEINQAEWIQKKERSRIFIDQSQGTIKDLWLDNFYRLGRVTYDLADIITTLYGGNEKLEIEFGADPKKIEIIPNGVQIDRFFPQRSISKSDPNIRKIGLVGRVVPIKDIKMFIKVCKIVLDTMPNVIFEVIGPMDEDEDYLQECIELCKLLGVEDKCIVTGPKNLIKENIYPQLDIMALTSISEGLPLTILEALCVGVPCVTTDVGACSELLNGRTEEDIALGISGYVVPIGNAEEFAQACLKILRDPQLHSQMVETGYKRIDTFYKQTDIVKRYKDLYLYYMKR
ncbi:MAG: GT4 family glycosyltransferase PelF [Thermodesulfobacteriota bacterium]|nr:GT4 family glycosyltransferase PelF [Thermodesulfobacteriota bacterium]